MLKSKLRLSFLSATLFLLIQCAPIAISAPFAADPVQRQQFVQSMVIGQTTLDQVRARWGNPTSGGILVEGPYRNGGDYWIWSSGHYTDYGTVEVRVDRNDIVRQVVSLRTVDQQRIFDDFSQATAAPTAQPAATTTPTVPEAEAEGEGGPKILGIELECLVFCI